MLRAAAAALLVLFSTSAFAQNVDIAGFYGTWEGNAISESEISVYFELTNRDIGVVVKQSPGGFTLTWNTVQRQRGDPNNPTEVLKSATLAFTEARPGVWRATDNRDPLEGGLPYAWAYIEKQTLVVNLLQIQPEGDAELQVYRRTLNGGFMELEFARMVDGQKVRGAKGRLIKISD